MCVETKEEPVGCFIYTKNDNEPLGLSSSSVFFHFFLELQKTMTNTEARHRFLVFFLGLQKTTTSLLVHRRLLVFFLDLQKMMTSQRLIILF
jgi:hypothetical protein